MNKIGSLYTDELFYLNRKYINLEVKNADERLQLSPFQYEVPNTLCHGYLMNQKGYIEVYEHHIKYEGIPNSEIGFITSLPLSPLDDFKFYFGFDQSDKVQIISKTRGLMIQKMHFEQIFIFNSQLCAEWFKVAEKNVKSQTRNISDLLQFKFLNFRTYLLVLIDDSSIALNKMITLVKQKLGQFQGENLFDKYTQLNGDQFKEYYSKNLFYSPIHQTVYCVYNVFDNIWNRPINEFFQYLLNNSNQDDVSLETILDYYELTKEQFNQKPLSIGQLAYDRQYQKSIPSFDNLREKYLEQKNTPEQFEYKCPLAVVEYAQSLRTLYFSSTPNTNPNVGLSNKESSVRKKNFTLKKPMVSLIAIKNLKKHFFTVAELDRTMQLPFIMLNIERQVVAQELRSLINLSEIKLNSLCHANQTPGYSQSENFEVFESLGDSILKVVSTYILYQTFSESKEEQYMTDKRVEFVSNNHLGIIASQTGLNYYVRQFHFRTENWVCHILPNVELNKEFKKILKHLKLNVHQMADVYEAVLGATFESTYKLEGVMRYLFETHHPIWSPNLDFKFLTESLKIDLDDYNEQENLINQSANYLDLVGDTLTFGENSIKQIEKTKIDFIDSVQKGIKKVHGFLKFLDYFQEKTLGYKFNDPVLLVEALTYKKFSDQTGYGQKNYQNLEFLGDAVLEGLIISNIFHEFQKKGMKVQNIIQILEVNPFQMHKVKVLLLSNQFMSRLVVLKGFHIFILNQDLGFQKEMETFIDKLDFSEKLVNSINSNIVVPKALSDIWESVCGAILIDGGWSAVVNTYGHFYKNFLIFASKFIFQIEDNQGDKLQNFMAQQKKQFKIIVKPQGENYHAQVMVEGVIICEAKDQTEKLAKSLAIMKATQILKL